MNVNSVSFTGTPKAAKKPLTKGQKAAAITGAVVTTAAVASAVAAFAMGKKVDGNILNKLGAGYKAIGSFVAQNAVKVGGFVAEKAQKAGQWIGQKAQTAGTWVQENIISKLPKFNKVVEVVEEVAEDAAENLQGLA